jgi:hypothetical protein
MLFIPEECSSWRALFARVSVLSLSSNSPPIEVDSARQKR